MRIFPKIPRHLRRTFRLRLVLIVVVLEVCALLGTWLSLGSHGERMVTSDWVWPLVPAGALLLFVLFVPRRVLFGETSKRPPKS